MNKDGHICNSGGDMMSYLGHFRSPKVVKAGHNVGAPGGKDAKGGYGRSKMAEANVAVKAAKKAGDAGAITAAKSARKEVRTEKREAFGALRKAKEEFKEGGFGGGRSKAVKEARANVRQNFAGAAKNYAAEEKRKAEKKEGGLFSSIAKAFNPTKAPWKQAKAAGSAAKKVAGAGMGAAKKAAGMGMSGAKKMGKMGKKTVPGA